MLDSFMNAVAELIGQSRAPSVSALMLLFAALLIKSVPALVSKCIDGPLADALLKGRAVRRIERARMFESNGLSHIAKCNLNIARELEIKKLSKTISGPYVPPYVFSSLLLVLEFPFVLALIHFSLRLISFFYEMTPNERESVVLCLYGSMLLIYFGLIVFNALLAISGSGSARGFLTKARTCCAIHSSGKNSFERECRLDWTSLARFGEDESSYLILYLGSRSLPKPFKDIPGLYRVSPNSLYDGLATDIAALRNTAVFTCSWDGTDGFELMRELRKSGVEAYYIGLVSDAWQLYCREFFSMNARYEEGLSKSRPLRKEELPIKRTDITAPSFPGRRIA